MVNKDWKEGDDVKVTLNYEKLPEIPETDFSKIKIKKLFQKYVVDGMEGSLEKIY